jgi:hypothetical protein
LWLAGRLVVQIKKLHSALVGDSHVQLGAVKPPEVHDDDDAAAAAMRQVMRDHNLSRSGAVHHMVRIAAGLPSFLP